jgi:hypothetical protein
MPFYPGITTPRWTPEEVKKLNEKNVKFTGADGKEKEVSLYDGTQIQRGLEREIRKGKRTVAVKEAAGLDASKEKNDLRVATKRLKKFLGDTGLRRLSERERVAK